MKVPRDLKKEGRRFWKKISESYDFELPHDIEILHQACRCLDAIFQAEQQIEADGAFIRNRFGDVREHPGNKIIVSNRTLFYRLIRELNLSYPPPDTRPESKKTGGKYTEWEV